MNYFKTLSNFTDNIHEEGLLKFHVDGSTESDILEMEMNDGLKKMKNGKVAGLDEIPAELLEHMEQNGIL